MTKQIDIDLWILDWIFQCNRYIYTILGDKIIGWNDESRG